MDPDLDARIEKEQIMLDQKERAKYIQDIQRDWKKYLFRTFTVNGNVHLAWQPNVNGQFVAKGYDWQAMEAVSFA